MIAFPVAGRALDYLTRALSLIRSQRARPIFVGSTEMLRQARAASDVSAGEIAIADFNADAIRAATSGEHSRDAEEAAIG